MSGKPMTASDLQSRLKSLVRDAIWDGLSRETIAAIMAAEAEAAKSD